MSRRIGRVLLGFTDLRGGNAGLLIIGVKRGENKAARRQKLEYLGVLGSSTTILEGILGSNPN